ncbi:MAG: HEAT repeat domain-containing protein [Candidatus Riflebacteria bacterium]|nr:HEAT repeat domain-containing protein [Candidatus Riflebacteria bacterium]
MYFSTFKRFFERVFFGFILLTLISFGYYFTIGDICEIEAKFQSYRVLLARLISRDILESFNLKQNLTPRLTNVVSVEKLAYAMVQQPEGEIIAKAENTRFSIGATGEIENKALSAPHLLMIPYEDPSGVIPLIEAALPIVSDQGRKLILRIGFFSGEEKDEIRQVLFRNLLLGSTIFVGFIIYFFVRRRAPWSLQITWMGGIGILILILFLSIRFTIQSWYDRTWSNDFLMQGMSMAKLLAINGKRFFLNSDENELRVLENILKSDENLYEIFDYLAAIKDEKYVYHSDPYFKGKAVSDPVFLRSLNSDKPLFKLTERDTYDFYMPVMNEDNRLGTLRLGLRRNIGGIQFTALRKRVFFLFAAALAVILFFIHQLAGRMIKDLGTLTDSIERVTGGDFSRPVFLDRHDELEHVAQGYNFMLMSLKERDLLGKNLHHYISKSIVNKTLKVLTAQEKSGEKVFTAIISIFFSGLNDAISNKTAPEVFSAIREVIQLVKKMSGESAFVHVQMDGPVAVFSHPHRHESLMKALLAAKMICQTLSKRENMIFSPRISVRTLESIHGFIEDDRQVPIFLGESHFDCRSLAQVQDPFEIMISEETGWLIKEVADLDEIEFSGENGRSRAFLFKGFKTLEELLRTFQGSSSWTKILVLKIIKNRSDSKSAESLVAWYQDSDETIRYHIMDVLEKLHPPGIVDFVVKGVREETNPRVLSKAISTLGKVGNESHVTLLADKLRINDRRVKANAVEALESIGGKKVYEFLNLLVDEQDNRVKANILIALGKYGDLKVFDLLSRMIKDHDGNMRASAAYALGKLGMAQGVEPLITALGDKDLNVRRQVVASLNALRADLDLDS